MKKKKILIALICLFVVLLSSTIFVSFSSNTEVQPVRVKSIIPSYDENSDILFKQYKGKYEVIFNDKNQVVDYKVVIENTEEYDVQITDIKISTPTEEFLQFEVDGVGINEVLKANETKELTFHLETTGIEGWGRNFNDELITTFSFAKNINDAPIIPPAGNDKVENQQPEAPDRNDKEENDQKEENKVESQQPEEPDINDKEDTSTDDKNKNDQKEENKVENPYTSDKGLLITLIIATCATGIIIAVVSKNKFAKYTIFIIALSSMLTLVKAEKIIDLQIKFNAIFKSQNVMLPSTNNKYNYSYENYPTYWTFTDRIKNFYIKNEISEVQEYVEKFDMTVERNGRVMAYVVKNKDDSNYYDVYLVADGIIYPNPDASYYFAYMSNLEQINNLEGLDTSKVTHMRYMFYCTGRNSKNLTLDLSGLDTSNVTSMYQMFYETGYYSDNFTLDVSNFDTSNVTDMRSMFYNTGYSSTNFSLDVSNFDTSNVTDMSSMFYGTGHNSTKLNTEITLNSQFVNDRYNYYNMFGEVAQEAGSQIIVNYTLDTFDIIDDIIATKSSNSNVVKGKFIGDLDNLPVGTKINISNEKFIIISQTDDTYTILAQYILQSNYRQGESYLGNGMQFADAAEWEATTGPKEIDIQTWSTNPKIYVNSYVEFIKGTLSDDSVTGDLITLKQLKSLGCTISEDYSYNETSNCDDSPYYDWLINSDGWWTKSAVSNHTTGIWFVGVRGAVYANDYHYSRGGIRPVITVSKEKLKDYINTTYVLNN